MFFGKVPEHFNGMNLESLTARVGDDSELLKVIEMSRLYIANGFVREDYSSEPKNGIVFAGTYGIGKSGLATSIFVELASNLKTAVWIDATEFIETVTSGDIARNEMFMEVAQTAEVLLLDGLGDKDRKAPESDDAREAIYRLVNFRHNNHLPMLVTTNLTASEMSVQFGQRTVERLLESCAWVRMGGANLRQF